MSFAFVQIMFIVCSVLDLCRVGSLEIGIGIVTRRAKDLCRVGSFPLQNLRNGFFEVRRFRSLNSQKTNINRVLFFVNAFLYDDWLLKKYIVLNFFSHYTFYIVLFRRLKLNR